MYQTDFDEFKRSLSDLCTAVNRPFTDDLARVFWEDLKSIPLAQVRQRTKALRAAGKMKFTSHDLKPEPEAPPPVSTYSAPPPGLDNFDQFGNRCLMKFLLSEKDQIHENTLQALVITKTNLVRDFREIHREEAVTADQMREGLMAAFRRVLTQRMAA